MSISTVNAIVGPYTLSTLPQTLAVTYPFQLAADLIVYSTGPSSLPVYPATVLTLNSDYTVTGGGYDAAGNMLTGSVTLMSGGANDVQVGDNIVIARRPPQTQLTSFLLTGFLTPEMIERALDKLTTLVQALQDGVNRSLRVPDVDGVLAEMLQSDRAGKIPAFDADGNLEFITISTATGQTEVDGTPGEIEVVTDPVTNVATVSLPGALIFTGKTIIGGTYKSVVAIGIGTATPSYHIDIANSTAANLRLTQTGGAGASFVLEASGDKANILSAKEITVAPMGGAPVGEFDASGWNGNAATATKLATARTINGVAFDGSANITIPAGSGDVVGPAGATDGNFALFDGTTGKLLKDGVSPNVFVLRSRNAINVKDYGATGDGATNDTAAIVAAIAALPAANAALYFPAGTYMTDTISGITGKLGLTIFGDGFGSSRIKARTASQVLNLASSNSYVIVRNLSFNGNGTVRAAGQHAVIMECSHSQFVDCEILNAAEFSLLIGAGAAVTNFIVSRCYVHDGYADGINLQAVTGGVVSDNIVRMVDDDCIAIGYSAGIGRATAIVVANNRVSARNDLGTSTGRGILVLRGVDILVIGNYVADIKQDGILVTCENTGTTSDVPSKTKVIGNFVTRTCISSGNGITVQGVIDCDLIDNVVCEIAGGNCIEIADYHEVLIQGGNLEQRGAHYCRGIHITESAGTYIWGTSWVGLTIKDVQINLLSASNNESIHMNPDAAITLDEVLIQNVTANAVPAGDYIYTNRLGTAAKICNNTAMQTRSISNGGAGLAPTLVNNN